MPEIDEKALKNQLKANEISNLYLIYGNESYLKSHYVSQIIKKVTPPKAEAFNLHEFDGKKISIDDMNDALESYPMMNPYRCVVVKDMDIETLSSDDNKKLYELIEDIPEYSVLVIWMNSVGYDAKRSSKARALIKAINKHGVSVNFNRKTERELIKLLCDGAKKRGCSLSQDNARYLIAVVGNDMRTLINELEKLTLYVLEDEIDRGHIDMCASKSLDANVFDITKAISNKQSDKAFQLLNDLLKNMFEPIAILGILASSYIDMYRAKVSSSVGAGYEDVINNFNYKGKEFRLKIANRSNAKLSLSQISRCIDELYKADIKLKSSRVDKKLILEESIVKLLRITA